MFLGSPRRRGLRAALLTGTLLSLGLPGVPGLSLLAPTPAQACGCFAPPDVATPIVQAGEKILFVNRNGILEMHVQIQYSGKPGDFGWVVPLPALPKNRLGNTGIDVGSTELFDQLDTTTRPTYVLQNTPCFQGRSSGLGCGAAASDSLAGAEAPNEAGMQMSPLVTQDSVGPYEYAVLKADSKTEMLNWLNTNRYVIPAGTDGAVGPYIRPGAYFLALRLKAGLSAGDVQPVVLRFPSDLATIPITLTAVGATPNMGVLVWLLGEGRAIPRNYFHTVINDAQIDWLNKASNYSEVVQKAVAEASGKHAFVTDYAGPSSRMIDVLDSQGRYDALTSARTTTDPVRFVQQLLPAIEQKPLDGGGPFGTSTVQIVRRGFALNGQLYAVLGRHIPMPSALVATGIKPEDYYQRIDYYLNQDRRANPARYADIEMALTNFKPASAAQELQDLIVTPTLEAGQLFREVSLPKLTRLYTVISPEDMNLDPAFSFNRELPEVSNIHNATLAAVCPDRGRDYAELSIQGGPTRKLSDDETAKDKLQPLAVPYSQRIEQLSDTGAPVVKTDNSTAINAAIADGNKVLGGGGCTASERRVPSGAGPLALLGAGIAAVLLRRRPRPA